MEQRPVHLMSELHDIVGCIAPLNGQLAKDYAPACYKQMHVQFLAEYHWFTCTVADVQSVNLIVQHGVLKSGHQI